MHLIIRPLEGLYLIMVRSVTYLHDPGILKTRVFVIWHPADETWRVGLNLPSVPCRCCLYMNCVSFRRHESRLCLGVPCAMNVRREKYVIHGCDLRETRRKVPYTYFCAASATSRCGLTCCCVEAAVRCNASSKSVSSPLAVE